MVPLESEFGWSRAVISAAVAVNIALFGLIGPFAASVMDRWGLRRVVLGALALLAASVAVSTADAHRVAAAAAVGRAGRHRHRRHRRWCWPRWSPRAGSTQRRGVVLGALSAANATGQLVFLPLLAGVVETQRLAHRGADRRRGRRGGLRRSCSCSCATGRATSACGRTARRRTPCRRPGAPPLAPLAALAHASRTQGVLGARRHVLRLRREHQRPDRHAPHLGLPRRRHPGDALGAAAGADGHLRHPRHDGLGLADRSLLGAAPAVRLLHAARPVAALPAGDAAQPAAPDSACSRSSTGSTGSPRCRRP